MEIELPDGTILEAPDDADVKAVVRGYNRARLKASNPAEYDSDSPEFKAKYGPLARGTRKVAIRGQGLVEEKEDDRFTEGIGSGMVRMSRGLGNLQNKLVNKHPLIKAMGGIDLPGKEFYSDEAIREQDALDQPLAEDTKGMLGQVTGQAAVGTAATLPIGGLGGLSTGGSVLTRTLGSAPVRAALEGAVAGAGAASPDEQGSGAVKGAILSAIIDRMFAGGGRVIRGLVNKSESARNLEQLAAQHGEEIFLPISQAASTDDLTSRLAKTAYGEGLSLIPGVRGQLTRQADDATAAIRNIALREATPDGVTLPADAGRRVQESLNVIRQGFENIYDDTIRSYAFNIPETFGDDVAAAVRREIPNVDDTTVGRVAEAAVEQMQRFSSGRPVIDGGNLLNVRDAIQELARRAPRVERPAMRIAQEQIEDLITSELTQGGARQNLADLARYGNLDEPLRHFTGLERASRAARARGGEFTMNQLARNASDPVQLDIAQQAGAVLNQPAAGTSFTGRNLIGGAGIVGVSALTDPITGALILGGGNVLATRTVQRALMGDTSAQRAIARIIQQNPRAVDRIAQFMRVVAAQSGDSNGGNADNQGDN